jgi:hypothetical protein
LVAKVLDLKSVITEDQLGCQIAENWITWDMSRAEWKAQRDEIRRYVFATDTTKTSNANLPWKNKTTVPKLCQIRDNLYANYMATLFPKRKWLNWEGSNEEDNTQEKKAAIKNYIGWATDYPVFKTELAKCVLDYIDYGNAFITPEWVDETNYVETEGGRTQVGYVGPTIRRISPLDIVMNPAASDFTSSPKIVRTLVSLGEVKKMIERETGDNEQANAVFDYLRGIRHSVHGYSGDISHLDDYYNVDGFDNFCRYLQGDYCELLTFYGDYYDYESGEFKKNQIVTVADRHKVVLNRSNPSYFGTAPIWHVGWRIRQDNLWAMGPLDNLVGMQYRIDHLENLKADVFDLIAFPVLKVKGNVDDFEWGPFERIYVSDPDSDVEMLAPPFQILQANNEIQVLETQMEEMAGAPKEAMGFRTPGEKTKYEVQRIENASSRIFQSKTSQFEEQFVEPSINGMLEMGRRMMAPTMIPIFDDELKATTFATLTPAEITGNGRIRPLAARTFAEKADKVQNLSNFFMSAIGQDPEIKVHFSTVKLAEMFEDLLEIAEHEVVVPYIRIAEQAEAQKQGQAMTEQTQMELMTPDGLSQDDFEGDDVIPQ